MRGAKPGFPAHLRAGKQLRIPQVPIEWLDAGSWRLPSGKALAEFALQAGFLTPLLFRTESFGRGTRHRSAAPAAPGREESPAAKQFEKEGNR